MGILKKIVNKNPAIFWFVIWILFFFLLSRVHPLASSVLLVMAGIFGLIYSIFTTYNYRMGKLKYVVFAAYNDDYSRFYSLFFSVAVLLVIGFSHYLNFLSIVWFSVGVLVALLLLANGFYAMPGGFLKIKSATLRLSGLAEAVAIEYIASIDIYHNRIVIKGLNGKVWLASNLKINELASKEIINYLAASLIGQAVAVTNHLEGSLTRQSKIVN